MKKIIGIITSFLITTSISAQLMQPKDIPTPNASDLGKYGDIPVSYYTGQPNITIPIISLKGRKMVMPIYMQYDASGVMVNSLPGWTGHNWTLVTGGSVTRIRNAQPDEYVQIKRRSSDNFENYFTQYSQLKNYISSHQWESLAEDVFWNKNDLQPDVFVFNFMGKSGRFIFGNDGQWKVVSDENLDVVFDVKDQNNYIEPFIDHFANDISSEKVPKCIKGFTLRDGQGNQYIFGGDNNSIDYNINFFNQEEGDRLNSFTAQTWYLTKVKDKYDNIIFELKYERGPYIAQFCHAYESTFEWSSGTNSPIGNIGYSYMRGNEKFPYGGNLNSPVYLKEIDSGEAFIKFESEDDKQSLQAYYPKLDVSRCPSVEMSGNHYYYLINSKKDDVTKYRYKGPDIIGNITPLYFTGLKFLTKIVIGNRKIIDLKYNDNSRKHLVQLKFHDSFDDLLNEEYDFQYNAYYSLPGDYLSYAIDHWGYCNSQSGNKYSRSNRDPNTSCTAWGALTEIKYPTGGVSVLRYNNNDYSSYRSDDHQSMVETTSDETGGGLRIASITNYADSNYTKIVNRETFSYLDPQTGRSSGELYAKPKYYWDNWKTARTSDGSYVTRTLIRNSSIIPLSNSFGPNIGYSTVTVTRSDGSWKRYHYYNISSVPDEQPNKFYTTSMDGSLSPYDTFTDMGYKRGKIISQETYNSSGKLEQKINYGYNQDVVTDYVFASNMTTQEYYFRVGNVFRYAIPKFDVVADTVATCYNNGNLQETHLYNKGNKIINVVYPYSHDALVRLTNSITTRRGLSDTKVLYTYPFLSENDNISKNISSRYFDLNADLQQTYFEGEFVNGKKTIYGNYNGQILPSAELNINHDNSLDTVANYLEYSKTCALTKYRTANGPIVKLKWDNHEINVSTINQQELNNGTKQLSYDYDFDSYFGLSYFKKPNNYTNLFYYDNLGRLQEIDNWNYLCLKLFNYHTINKK